jgi:hypothetical protein
VGFLSVDSTRILKDTIRREGLHPGNIRKIKTEKKSPTTLPLGHVFGESGRGSNTNTKWQMTWWGHFQWKLAPTIPICNRQTANADAFSVSINKPGHIC